MSHLLQLVQRIKTTDTIKKTTNAMRLISMSTHTRLRQSKSNLDAYHQEIERLRLCIQELGESEDQGLQGFIPATGLPADQEEKRELFIVIGSQKGLCGNFNETLGHIFLREKRDFDSEVLVIGKQMKSFLLFQEIEPTISYDEFGMRNLFTLANEITSLVRSSVYGSVTVFYTYPKSFFLHVPTRLQLKRDDFIYQGPEQLDFDAIKEQSYKDTYDFLGYIALKSQIEKLLLDSLLAEAAARFLSMDAATRNADDLINVMRLDYNKLRQATITRELTDLSGSFVK